MEAVKSRQRPQVTYFAPPRKHRRVLSATEKEKLAAARKRSHDEERRRRAELGALAPYAAKLRWDLEKYWRWSGERFAEIKQEKAEAVEEKEDLQETLGYQIRTTNALHSKIDDLIALALASGADPAAVCAIRDRPN